MKYVPYDYQKYAEEFILEHPACALFLDCGLGKTVVTLSAVHKLLFDYFSVKKVLVVAPLRVAQHTWTGEKEKWDHLGRLELSLVLGSAPERIKALSRQAHIYVINRENIPWLVEQCPWDFDMVILDELSSFKSHAAKRFKALRKVRPLIKRIVGLTGTPAPNGLMDLWSEIFLLDQGERLGRFIGNYRRDYFDPDKQNQRVVFSYKPKAGAEQIIHQKISDICVSMKAVDHLKMPERIDNQVAVFMDSQEMKLYRTLEREMLLPFADGDIDAVNAAVLANKLLQMAGGAVYDENKQVKSIHDKKLAALEDLVEAANGKPVLIFYSYQHEKERIAKALPVRDLATGADIDAWNRGEIPLALVHPASAGHGLNLQFGGSTAVWFGLTWSLELYQQANARLWRQGQKHSVVVHHLIAKGTMDEQVMRALATKHTGQTALLDAVKARIGGGKK